MQSFSKKKENVQKYSISKAEYDENGAEYFKRNPFSNVYDAWNIYLSSDFFYTVNIDLF